MNHRHSRLRSALALIAGFSLCGGAEAQDVYAVVPQSAATIDGNRWMASHFREPGARRVQLIIAARHLSGLATKRIHQVSFRKDVKKLEPYRALRGDESVRLQILASWSDADPAKPSIVYATNAPSPVEVFRGEVKLPRVGSTESRTVASWSPAEAPTVTFSRPLLHVPGKSLVLDFLSDGGRTGRSWFWPTDAVTLYRPGVVREIGTSCWSSRVNEVVHVVKGSLRPGMHVKSDTATPPNPVAAFLLFGLSDKKALGSIPLPFKIADPNCQIFVSPDVVIPSLFYPGADGRDDGMSAAEIATPYLASLFGSTIYFQYFFLHNEGSGLALKTSNGVAATFTKSAPQLGVSMVASIDKLATAGRVFLDYSPVLRFAAK